ncbi:hypothetical protein J6590_033719 [Homalodisca vitripennis]|nr:hypothetical protein J6590_033719 [Homalodisca vitripennis]
MSQTLSDLPLKRTRRNYPWSVFLVLDLDENNKFKYTIRKAGLGIDCKMYEIGIQSLLITKREYNLLMLWAGERVTTAGAVRAACRRDTINCPLVMSEWCGGHARDLWRYVCACVARQTNAIICDITQVAHYSLLLWVGASSSAPHRVIAQLLTESVGGRLCSLIVLSPSLTVNYKLLVHPLKVCSGDYIQDRGRGRLISRQSDRDTGLEEE